MISCVISAPVDCYAGYGERAVDFVKELIRNSDWDIKILSQRWGNTRMGYLEDHGEVDLISRIIPGLEKKPDVWIQITVPNEFQPVGRYNIGITAGVETTLCDPSWIDGCNRMDLVVASSELSKQSMYNPIYKNNKTGQEFKAVTPCQVLFEGVDLNKYKLEPKKSEVLKDLKNSWNFLMVGHWLQGNFGEDRKNIPFTIKVFLETFKDRDKAPGLIIKTSRCTASTLDREDLLARICNVRDTVKCSKSLPNIYLLHGDLTDAEMSEVYNDPRVKAMVTLTKGEGFGRPVVEFASVGKPVLASAWSGYRDVLPGKGQFFVGGQMKQVDSSAVQEHIILPQASWFNVDANQASAGLLDIYNNYDVWKIKAEKDGREIRSKYSLDAMGAKILDEIVKPVEEALSKMPKEPEFVKIS